MTEEIIIDGAFMIDGINVTKCMHFTKQYNYGYCELSNDSCDEFQYNCAKNKNCYYKQLKRLEQENKELKGRYQKLLEDLSCSNGCLRNKIDIEIKYRSALEEIKKYAEYTKEDAMRGYHSDSLFKSSTIFDGIFHRNILCIDKINEVLNDSRE